MENVNKIVEIKKGQTGTGLLIESDGYISGDVSENNKRIIKEAMEFRREGEWNIPNPFVLDVVMQKFGIENANGRIYPEHVLKREVEKYQQLIRERMALGECNHPEETTIDLGRVSHNILECHWEGNTLVGKIEFNLTEGFRKQGICSSFGDTCANLILNGFKIGVSSRGMGSVKSQLGKTIVDDNFSLICFDIVATPSTPNAYIGTRSEIEPYIESDLSRDGKPRLNEKIERLRKALND